MVCVWHMRHLYRPRATCRPALDNHWWRKGCNLLKPTVCGEPQHGHLLSFFFFFWTVASTCEGVTPVSRPHDECLCRAYKITSNDSDKIAPWAQQRWMQTTSYNNVPSTQKNKGVVGKKKRNKREWCIILCLQLGKPKFCHGVTLQMTNGSVSLTPLVDQIQRVPPR